MLEALVLYICIQKRDRPVVDHKETETFDSSVLQLRLVAPVRGPDKGGIRRTAASLFTALKGLNSSRHFRGSPRQPGTLYPSDSQCGNENLTQA